MLFAGASETLAPLPQFHITSTLFIQAPRFLVVLQPSLDHLRTNELNASGNTLQDCLTAFTVNTRTAQHRVSQDTVLWMSFCV